MNILESFKLCPGPPDPPHFLRRNFPIHPFLKAIPFVSPSYS